MSVDLICPECGGVIGGVGMDADGRGPCTCFANSDEKPEDKEGTVSMPAPQEVIERTTSSMPEKVCIVCGKNLSGHRRVKDSRGYMCYNCAKAEIEQEQAGTIPCAECGRRVKEKALITYLGIKICRRCYDDHKESKKVLVKKIATKQYEMQEKRTLIILGVIVAILGLIVLFTQLHPH
ncbi:MAG TPA: hypothetical protein VGF52_00490 [Tepidisphaeraceae bacterium]